jgi:acetyl-CoA acetyltransferase
MTREAVILSAVRTPFGRYNGTLKDVRPDDLAALVMREMVERAGVNPHEIEDVILGCANQAGEDNRNVARMAVLLAGFPIEVGGQTVNRLCGSSLQAVNSAAQVLQCVRELEIDEGKLNVNGGAIAFGHPLGASGARILGTLLYELRRRGGRYGLTTMCMGVGHGIAMVIEML